MAYLVDGILDRRTSVVVPPIRATAGTAPTAAYRLLVTGGGGMCEGTRTWMAGIRGPERVVL